MMPGTRPRRSPSTRLFSGATRRAPVPSGGVGIQRVPRVADRSSGVGGVGIFGEFHYIEGWDVADDSDATFRTTFKPLEGSWNLELNGLRVHRDEFTIDGKVITITDPTDLFLGADTQGSPWDLEIQYDYVRGVETPVVFVDDGGAFSGSTMTPTWPAGLEAGDTILSLHVNGGGSAPTYPSGWLLHPGATLTMGGGSNVICHLYEYVADGTESGTAGFTIPMPSGSGFQQAHWLAYRGIGAVTTATPDGPTATVTYDVPADAASQAVRFVVVFDTSNPPSVAGATVDYQTSASPAYLSVTAYHEQPPVATTAVYPLGGSKTFGSVTVGVSGS